MPQRIRESPRLTNNSRLTSLSCNDSRENRISEETGTPSASGSFKNFYHNYSDITYKSSNYRINQTKQ